MKIEIFKEEMENVLPKAGFTPSETNRFIADCIRALPEITTLPFDRALFRIDDQLARIGSEFPGCDPRQVMLDNPRTLLSAKKPDAPAPPSGEDHVDIDKIVRSFHAAAEGCTSLDDIERTARAFLADTGKRPHRKSGPVLHLPAKDYFRSWLSIDAQFVNDGLRIAKNHYASLSEFLDARNVYVVTPERVFLSALITQQATGRRPSRAIETVTHGPLKDAITWDAINRIIMQKRDGFRTSGFKSLSDFLTQAGLGRTGIHGDTALYRTLCDATAADRPVSSEKSQRSIGTAAKQPQP